MDFDGQELKKIFEAVDWESASQDDIDAKFEAAAKKIRERFECDKDEGEA